MSTDLDDRELRVRFFPSLPSFLESVQSNAALLLGALVVLVLLAARSSSVDRNLRRDLRGAIFLLVAFGLLRGMEWWFRGRILAATATALHVGLMLSFSFGLVRTGVTFVLWFIRLRGTPVPKILRDVIDLALYLVVAIPVLKSELGFSLASLSGLVATSAAATIFLGLASQETLGNLIAGLSIQIERPFQVGDYVKIKNESGRVVQVAWRATRIETSRREVITLPNNVVSKEAVKNFSRGSEPVAIDVPFGAPYETAPNHIKRLVLETLGEIDVVLKQPAPLCRTTEFGESAIHYLIRFYIANFGHRNRAKDELLTRLWYRLHREKISLPYPQRSIHLAADAASEDFPAEARARLLQSVDIFSVLEAEDRAQLGEEMVPRRFGQGERIIEEGATGHTFYVVASGTVSVRTGKTLVEVTRLGPGKYFGEMSLLTGEPRAATVVAVEDATLFEMDRPTLARMFAERPNLARELSARLAERRTQLKAVVEANGTADFNPEAGRILSRLRQIFGLKSD